MRAWAVEVHVSGEVRPHHLDERVLTSLSEALDAHANVFDVDVVGDRQGVGARFDVVAARDEEAVNEARRVFLAALKHALGPDGTNVRLEVTAREQLRA